MSSVRKNFSEHKVYAAHHTDHVKEGSYAFYREVETPTLRSLGILGRMFTFNKDKWREKIRKRAYEGHVLIGVGAIFLIGFFITTGLGMVSTKTNRQKLDEHMVMLRSQWGDYETKMAQYREKNTSDHLIRLGAGFSWGWLGIIETGVWTKSVGQKLNVCKFAQVLGASPAASTGHYAQGRPRKELYEYCQKKGLKLELRCDRSAPTAPWVCVAIIEAIGKQSQGTGLNKAKASDEACLKLLQSLGDSALVEAASGSKKQKGKKSLGVDTAAMEWYECSDPETPPTTSSPGGAARSPGAVFRNGPAGYNSDNAKAAVFEWLKRRK
ncbi:ATP-dependent RNA helicase A, partial [Perkinsus olseni]